ncbi:MAG: pyruvate kinase [Gemmataceae bacterium]
MSETPIPTTIEAIGRDQVSPFWDAALLNALIDKMLTIRADMLQLEEAWSERIQQLHPSYRTSARNLLHYIALRRHDLRPLQEKLAALGLSSLGRAEAHVRASLEAVLRVLHHLAERPWTLPNHAPPPLTYQEGRALLERHTKALLGPSPNGRTVRIMVTMPSEAADDAGLVRDMLASGMDCARLNCAHDDPAAWGRMIHNLHRAEEALGKKCQILMDLAGPKLRTGDIEAGPAVLKWRPRRDALGRVTAPARVWLRPEDSPVPPPTDADAVVPVPGEWLSPLTSGTRVQFRDARGAKRALTIVYAVGSCRWAEATQTAYVATGTELRAMRGDGKKSKACVGALPPRAQTLLLHIGDTLLLTRDQTPGQPAVYDPAGRLLYPATIPCTLPEVFADVRPGERIWLDDGKIGGIIRAVCAEHIRVEITHARPKGEKLAADKGINLPESTLRLPAITAKDAEDLAFIARHADLVGLSFVHAAADVNDLEQRLSDLQAGHVGIVLKIETRRAFEQLPNLLLASMRRPRDGVMIARGDLAVECGYERLAEVQEEILWICETAHFPVIWATQVLENLAKEGLPSRAEITDAAMGVRAECVMLNKGPHIVGAIRTLDDILRRMQYHQSKKTAMLRELRVARHFLME